ncbi:MAG: cytochrome c3 family protein [Desulfuromonadales bacterium]|nr:cytochrome c3 family protein [Desulfuromonadales bacterium]
MTRRWIFLTIILLLTLPSLLSARWIKDVVYLETESAGKIEFSHYSHMEMEDVGRNCQKCHNHLFHVVTKNNKPVTMAEMEEGQSCGACHNDKLAFSVSGDCATCHAGDVVIQTAEVGGVDFSHEIHTDMFGCDECHPDLFIPESDDTFATMSKMEAGGSCGACHDGDTAFGVGDDCTTCHVDEVVIPEEDMGDVTFPHSAHIDMFGCDECHPDMYKAEAGATTVGMEAMEEGESCGACHDGDTAFGVADDESCEACHAM